MIISSNRTHPILKVKPTLCKPIEEDLITLVHLAIPSAEHYEACKEEVTDADFPELNKDNSTTKSTHTNDQVHAAEEEVFEITPRKQANYKSPKKKNRTRKKKAMPATWKRNIRKGLRSSGKEYISTSAKL